MPKTFYKYDKLFSYNCTYNGVVGGRGIGKTYGIKKKSIQDFIRKGEQFIYLRRYKEELTLSRTTFMSDIEHHFPDWDFRAMGKYAQMSPVSKRNDKRREWYICGYFLSLSTAQSMKSVSFIKVTKIIYDEFIIEKGYTRYIPEEVTAFNNFYSTVDRYRGNVKVYFLANSVAITNPFFISWKIDPKKSDENGILRFGGKFGVFHFPDSKEFESEVYKTDFGQFIKDSEYAQYAVGNQFSDNTDSLIGKKNSAARYRFSVETQNGTFSVWHEIGTNYYYIQEPRPHAETMFTLLIEKMDSDKTYLQRNNKLLQNLRAAFSHGRMFFDNTASRNAMLEVFK